MSRIREALNHLQREMERVNELIQGFSDGNSQILTNIQVSSILLTEITMTTSISTV